MTVKAKDLPAICRKILLPLRPGPYGGPVVFACKDMLAPFTAGDKLACPFWNVARGLEWKRSETIPSSLSVWRNQRTDIRLRAWEENDLIVRDAGPDKGFGH